MTQEYKLCEDSDPIGLAQAVNKELAKGWTLYGQPGVAVCDRGAIFIQALTKEIPNETK